MIKTAWHWYSVRQEDPEMTPHNSGYLIVQKALKPTSRNKVAFSANCGGSTVSQHVEECKLILSYLPVGKCQVRKKGVRGWMGEHPHRNRGMGMEWEVSLGENWKGENICCVNKENIQFKKEKKGPIQKKITNKEKHIAWQSATGTPTAF